MARPDTYDTPCPTIYQCIVCARMVHAEALLDQEGNIRGYAPVSRYWCDDGVFCGAACGLKYRGGIEINAYIAGLEKDAEWRKDLDEARNG